AALRPTVPTTAPARASEPAASSPGDSKLIGTYRGTISGEQQGQPISMQVSFTLIQEGSKVSGTWTATGGRSGILAGSIVGPNKLAVQVKQVNPCPGDFTGTATIGQDGTLLGGSYTGSACGASVRASFTVVRQGLAQ